MPLADHAVQPRLTADDLADEEFRWYAELRRDDLPPTDEELWDLAPDPDTDPPATDPPAATDLPAANLPAADPPAAAKPGSLRPAAATLWSSVAGPATPGDGAPASSAGFSAGGAADRLVPGMVLSGLAEREWAGGLTRVSDDALIGLMTAWRRLASWAAAGEAAAIAELSQRRLAEVAAGADPRLAEHVGDEIAPPLTLTMRGADLLLSFATRLEALPLTRSALAAGEIDRAKAQVIVDEVTGLDPAHAAAVEAAVIGQAPGQTTGQLRAATRRAVLAADPGAARRRREAAQREARVEVWDEPAGTAALAGRDLPPAEVLAADRHISSVARRLRAAGVVGTLDQLRACAYTGLLAGDSTEVIIGRLTTATTSPGGASSAAGGPLSAVPQAPGPLPAMPLAGTVHLTMPLTALFDGGTAPGEVAGFGPVSAGDAQALIRQLAAHEATRWCITLTGKDGRALAHGCARLSGSKPASANTAPGDSGWELTVTIRPFADAQCFHAREGKGYSPSASLRHLICVRQRTCAFPGCRRPAIQCDLDHTVPYDRGGKTCECNLAPLCRAHHQAKQLRGWRLEQPRPGVLIWTLPHGRRYRAGPSIYPPDDPGADPAA